MAKSLIDKLGVLFLGIAALFVFTLCISHGERAEAAFQYNSSESSYLHKLTPILTELSQLGTEVSKTAIALQSAPQETCSNEFGFYQGIVVSLRNRLNSVTPPPRIRAIHIKSLEGLSDYLTGLNIYGSSCVDKDYAMKSKLVNKGTEYLTKASQTIISVIDLIANPDLIPISTSPEDQINEWCGAKWANNYQMQEHCIQTQTEARAKLTNMLQMNPPRTPGRKVILDCSSLWKDRSGSHNYRMIVFCAQNQLGK